ncbi:hypothetical protein H7X68_01035 [Candidatus Saccharibacteria bacterium]|nr:hypothetical protein [Candidatus Saccharibacteria bacterium]
MKKTIQESFTLLIASRYLLVLCSALLLLALSFVIYIGLNVRPSELQLVSHYSAFGVTHLYRDQWFYLLNFGVFGLFASIIHVIIAVKIFIVKGISLAILFAWLGIVIILLAWITSFAVLNVWYPL